MFLLITRNYRWSLNLVPVFLFQPPPCHQWWSGLTSSLWPPPCPPLPTPSRPCHTPPRREKEGVIIVNRADWLWSPTNIKGGDKDAKIYVGRSTTVHNLLFRSHTLWTNYVTNTFLLVSYLVRSKQLLCFAHGQGQEREQKHTTKNFDEFHNHSPLLTMAWLNTSSHHSKFINNG